MELIPSIDLRGGRVVRLEQGDYARETIYDADPVEQSRAASPRPARAGSTSSTSTARATVAPGTTRWSARSWPRARSIARAGRAAACARASASTRALDAGAARVVIGTAALEEPELLQELAARYPGRIILGLDARDGRVAVRGWRETTRARRVERRAGASSPSSRSPRSCTPTSAATGCSAGPNVEATAALARRSPFPVLASGGVGSLDDLERLARTRVIAGAIVGRAIYSGRDPRRRRDREARGVLTKRIIPCLDVKDGRVVKGVQFVDLIDAGDPVEVAAAYDAQGADELCFLDINASHENRAHDVRPGRAHRRPTDDPVLGRRRRALGRRRARAAARRRGQGLGELRGGRRGRSWCARRPRSSARRT